MSNDFNCQQLEPLLSAYHDGELTEIERADAELHLSNCAACQNRLLEITAVARSLKSLPRLNPKTDVAANIEQLIAKQPKGIARVGRPVIWSAAGIAAAAAILIMSVNFRGNTNLIDSSLTATANGSQTSSNQRKNVKPQDLEIAQGVEPTENRVQSEPASTKIVKVAAEHEPHATRPSDDEAKKEGASQEQHERPATDHGSRKNSKYNPRLEVATTTRTDVTTSNTTTAGGSASAHLDGSEPQLVASGVGAGTIGADSNLVSVYDTEQRGVTEELGITTDEDGLYAIKL